MIDLSKKSPAKLEKAEAEEVKSEDVKAIETSSEVQDEKKEE